MTFTVPALVAAAAVIVTVLSQTAALFYWGGGIRQMLRDHERRIARLEEGSS